MAGLLCREKGLGEPFLRCQHPEAEVCTRPPPFSENPAFREARAGRGYCRDTWLLWTLGTWLTRKGPQRYHGTWASIHAYYMPHPLQAEHPLGEPPSPLVVPQAQSQHRASLCGQCLVWSQHHISRSPVPQEQEGSRTHSLLYTSQPQTLSM